MWNRRQTILWLTTALVPHVLRAEEDWEKALRESYSKSDPISLGHRLLPPSDAAWAEVDSILQNAPKPPTTAIQVAHYLSASVPEKYREAWPEPNVAKPTYANPLIVRLFLSTQTVPSGDTTPWCAAFMNWCVQRAGMKGTSSASSQSFVDWGQEVWSLGRAANLSAAEPGDVAVLRKQSDPAHGHVAFFVSIDPRYANTIDVIGGNQLLHASGIVKHLIDTMPLRIDADLQLIAIRRGSTT